MQNVVMNSEGVTNEEGHLTLVVNGENPKGKWRIKQK